MMITTQSYLIDCVVDSDLIYKINLFNVLIQNRLRWFRSFQLLPLQF